MLNMTGKGIHIVVGARPNYMKVKVLLELLPDAILIHTGQHFSDRLFGSFLDDLNIRRPDVLLQPVRESSISMISSMMLELEKYWLKNTPKLVVVVGDVNSTLAASLTASRIGICVAHLEAGLRSRDLAMPEEFNRIAADAASQYLWCSEQSGVDNLEREGRIDHVYLVGNTMIDCLISMESQINSSEILHQLELKPQKYAVLTLHRPSNVDQPEKLHFILEFLSQTGISFIFPKHPRVQLSKVYKNITVIEPLFYVEFIKLVQESHFVMTDSGGLQEETTFLNLPCITLRNNTERPSTISSGTNELLKDIEDFQSVYDKVLSKQSTEIKYWDGKASQRIVELLSTLL